jgi:hypothetical protein
MMIDENQNGLPPDGQPSKWIRSTPDWQIRKMRSASGPETRAKNSTSGGVNDGAARWDVVRKKIFE